MIISSRLSWGVVHYISHVFSPAVIRMITSWFMFQRRMTCRDSDSENYLLDQTKIQWLPISLEIIYSASLTAQDCWHASSLPPSVDKLSAEHFCLRLTSSLLKSHLAKAELLQFLLDMNINDSFKILPLWHAGFISLVWSLHGSCFRGAWTFGTATARTLS